MTHAWRSRLIGLLLLAGVVVGGVVDLVRTARNWDRLGPVGPDATMPEFRLDLLDGGSFGHTDLTGKVTLLSFWASWCGVCRSEMPMYREIHRLVASRPEIQLVLVNREGGGVTADDARAVANRVRAEQGLEMPIALDDGSLYRAMRGSVLPHTVLVDRVGIVRYVHEGRVTRSTLETELESLLAQ